MAVYGSLADAISELNRALETIDAIMPIWAARRASGVATADDGEAISFLVNDASALWVDIAMALDKAPAAIRIGIAVETGQDWSVSRAQIQQEMDQIGRRLAHISTLASLGFAITVPIAITILSALVAGAVAGTVVGNWLNGHQAPLQHQKNIGESNRQANERFNTVCGNPENLKLVDVKKECIRRLQPDEVGPAPDPSPGPLDSLTSGITRVALVGLAAFLGYKLISNMGDRD